MTFNWRSVNPGETNNTNKRLASLFGTFDMKTHSIVMKNTNKIVKLVITTPKVRKIKKKPFFFK